MFFLNCTLEMQVILLIAMFLNGITVFQKAILQYIVVYYLKVNCIFCV